MTRRVLFQGGEGVRSTLKVSLPGWDVVTAPLNGLAFDAEGAAFHILARGEFDQICPFFNSEAVTTQVVSFANQPRPPFACFYFRQFSGGTPSAVGTSPWITIAVTTFPTFSTTYNYARVDVFSNQAHFTIQHRSFSSFRVNYCFFVEDL